jgi:Tetratricopeptide repeat
MRLRIVTLSSILAAAFLLSLTPLEAQFDSTQCTLRIDVVNVDGSRVTAPLRVELTQGFNNIPIAVTMTGDSGTAEFEDLHAGDYRVRVTGESIQPAESGTIEIEGGRAFASEMVPVHPATKDNAGNAPGGATVDVADLKVPKNAADEYNRANKEISHGHCDKAITHLEHAIALYPKFCSAYNNLAVCYFRLGKRDLERQSLERAVNTNNSCVPPMVSLAKLDLEEQNTTAAAPLITKALAAEPNNVGALALQARLDLMEDNFDLAIAAAQKVNNMPHKGYAIVHYIAARAYEQEGHIAEAIKELQAFLKEEPSGPGADLVRKEMQGLQKTKQD